MIIRGTALAIALALGVSGTAAAEAYEFSDDPAEKGRQFAEISDRTDAGFTSSVSEMRMILENEYGETSERELRQKTLEVPAEDLGDKSLIVFDRPRDVEGTSLLTHARILDPDDQWMFLPAVKRVKRISSANKSGPFMGSECAFEDFSSQEVGKYSYKWLRDGPCPEPVADRTCHVTERVPLYENSGYTRQITWTDTQDYQPRKVEYFNRRDAHLKTLWLRDYRRYLDQYWRAHELYMENHITGKKTTLTWENYEFQTGLDESDFDQASLKRAR